MSQLTNEMMLIVLMSIRDKKKIVDICPLIGKSQRIVSDYIKEGIRKEWVTGDYGPTGRKMKHGTRRLTDAGKKHLKDNGIENTDVPNE